VGKQSQGPTVSEQLGSGNDKEIRNKRYRRLLGCVGDTIERASNKQKKKQKQKEKEKGVEV
jgi:hypothetical protein